MSDKGDIGAQSEQVCFTGDVGSSVYPIWIAGHARRLGVQAVLLAQGDDRLDLMLTGPAALRDAMVLGCSLGPREVLVDAVRRDQTGDAS